ncbi:hypothetical protein K449DRAFT_204939 [Hypoxylon sp. EC38]|nr:hypothetical protein K449DRAFT_204939 [Hypoxylon sp. EC38]
MDVFPSFTNLPPELRRMIWTYALHHEARFRLVLLCNRQVLALKYLSSPFLSVNFESRRIALKFYRVKLDVHHIPIPGPSNTPLGGYDKYRRTMLGPGRMHEGLAERALAMIQGIGTNHRRPTSGSVYISPEYDTFMFDWSILNQLTIRGGLDGLVHVSDEVPYAACADIRNLIRATRPSYPEASEYSQRATAELWDTDVFTGFHAFQTCGIGAGIRLVGILPWLVRYLWRTGDFTISDEARVWEWGERPVWRPGNTQEPSNEMITALQPLQRERRSKVSAIIEIMDQELDMSDERFRWIVRASGFGPLLLSAVQWIILERARRRSTAATTWRRRRI